MPTGNSTVERTKSKEVQNLTTTSERLCDLIKQKFDVYDQYMQNDGARACVIDNDYNVLADTKGSTSTDNFEYNMLKLVKETLTKYPGLFLYLGSSNHVEQDQNHEQKVHQHTTDTPQQIRDKEWEMDAAEATKSAVEVLEVVDKFLAENVGDFKGLEALKKELHTINNETINKLAGSKEASESTRQVQSSTNSSKEVEDKPASTRTKIIKTIRRQEPQEEGFSLYGTKDEEGLHVYEGNDDEEEYDDQEEYDIEELNDDVYDGRTEHHIELELQSECDIHGAADCDCPVYDEEYGQEESYDFTFEYNSEGRLVPTTSSVTEYFKSKVNETRGRPHKSSKITELDKRKKKKKPKKTKKSQVQFDPDSIDTCLFCDYEALYGHPPRQLMKWIDYQEHDQYMRNKLSSLDSFMGNHLPSI